PRSATTSRPSNSMVPAVGASAASTSFDVVVLPHPDSPTSPSVSPALIVKLIPSTALTSARRAPKSEPPIGKYFWRSRTARSGSVTRRSFLDGRPTADAAVAVQIVLTRLVDATAVHRPLAAGMETAAGREVREIRRLARDAAERLLDAELRDRIEQRPGVGMPWPVEQATYRLHLHDPSGVHHRDPVAHLGHDAEVVRDEDQRDAGRALQVLQQIQVLQLNGDVEIRGGLVRDDDPRSAGLRDGADDALPHPSAHLMRKVLHAKLGRRNPYGREELLHSSAQRRPAEGLVIVGRLSHLVVDREQRIQRRHRILQDRRDPTPADPPHFRLALRDQVLAVE